jgi:hypothetical protein
MPTDHNPLFDGPDGQEYYPGTGFPVWPHRRVSSISTADEQNRPQIDDPYVSYCLNRLDELEKVTRPIGGPASAKGKDMAAFEALVCAGELTMRLAGWAIAHQIGLAVKGLQHVPEGSPESKDYQLRLQEQSVLDSHEHEKVGAWEPRTLDRMAPETLDPIVARKCVANLLKANPGGWPDWFCEQTLGAIEALEYGEVRPMFSPVSAGRRRDYTLLKLQLRAVAMVAFRRRAYRMTKEIAFTEVAAGLNVSVDTLKSWEFRLRKDLGRLSLDDAISTAQFHASFVASDDTEKRHTGIALDTSHHDAGYDAVALADLGKQYDAALRRGAGAQKHPLRTSK